MGAHASRWTDCADAGADGVLTCWRQLQYRSYWFCLRFVARCRWLDCALGHLPLFVSSSSLLLLLLFLFLLVIAVVLIAARLDSSWRSSTRRSLFFVLFCFVLCDSIVCSVFFVCLCLCVSDNHFVSPI